MEHESIDLSHLTEEERAKLVAVIDADEELRIRSLSLSLTSRRLSGNDRRSNNFQQLHLKLESDHRYSSELLRRSLTAVSEQRRKNGGNNLPTLDSRSEVDLAVQTAKISLNDLPEIKEYEKDKGDCLQKQHSIVIKSSSVESLNSLTSMYSASAGKGDYDIRGKLEVAVSYKDRQLFVQVIRAKGLAAAKKGGVSNPYVKIYLLPDREKRTKRKTGVQQKTTNPVFDETLKIKIEQSHLSFRTLWLSVWDWDIFGRNHFLGEVHLPLSSLDLTQSKNYWYTLQDEDGGVFHSDSYHGKLQVGLMYSPKVKVTSLSKKTTKIVGTLHIAIHQAQDLPIMDENDLTDATAKIYLLPHQSSSGKHKTKVINHSLNPVWNEQFAYENVYMNDLTSGRVLEVTVWDYDRRGSNDFIGGLHIGPHPDSVPHRFEDWMDSTGDEATHWEAMLQHPGEWVEQWHTLRPSMKPASKYYAPPNPKSAHTFSIRGLRKTSTTTDHDGAMLPGSNTATPEKSEEPLPEQEGIRKDSTYRKCSYDITGEVLVGVYYKNSQLHIHVDRARGLAAADSNGYSDPYVKAYLLPNRAKQKTSTKKKTLDPIYNETLKFKLSESEVISQTLWLCVWDWDRIGSNQFLGEIHILLSSINLKDTTDHWYRLQDKDNMGQITLQSSNNAESIDHAIPGDEFVESGAAAFDSQANNHVSTNVGQPPENSEYENDHSVGLDKLPFEESDGESKVVAGKARESNKNAPQQIKEKDTVTEPTPLNSTGSLYMTTACNITGEVLVGVYYKNNQLHIHVDRARGLVAADSNGYSDPYIKTYLLPDRAKHTKKKTSVKKKTLDPIYNEMLKYKILKQDLVSRILWLSVWDWDRFNKNQFLGEIYLSFSSLDLSDTTSHWYQLQDKDDGSYPDLPSSSATSLQRSQLTEAVTYRSEAIESSLGNQRSVTVAVEEEDYQPEAAMNSAHNETSSNLTKSLSSLGSMSVYSEAGGKGAYDITGEVLVGVYYKNNQLRIHVDRARGLAAADSNGYSDPYIKTYLLPDKAKLTKQKTAVKKKTLNPVYNKELLYDLSKSELSSRTLLLTVWNWNRFGSNQFLGDIRLPLASLDLTVSRDKGGLDQWYLLQDKEEAVAGEVDAIYRGELKVGLNYRPNSGSKPIGTLVIDVKQAKELPVMDGHSTDSVVKLYLLPNQKSSGKRKTCVIKNNLNPVWEEKFTFEDVSLEELSFERVLEISVWNYDSSSHTFIGGLRIGPAPGSAAEHKDWMDSIGDEVTHWEDMLACPGEWVEQWHTLRTTMNPRNDLDLYTYFSINSES